MRICSKNKVFFMREISTLVFLFFVQENPGHPEWVKENNAGTIPSSFAGLPELPDHPGAGCPGGSQGCTGQGLNGIPPKSPQGGFFSPAYAAFPLSFFFLCRSWVCWCAS